jgi:predicted transport protein
MLLATGASRLGGGPINGWSVRMKRLRVSLNIPFADLDAPKRLAKNVTGAGRWCSNARESREILRQP